MHASTKREINFIGCLRQLRAMHGLYFLIAEVICKTVDSVFVNFLDVKEIDRVQHQVYG
jgi:hypothetical protein